MAVQKSKKSRSRRGMRRAHDSLTGSTLATDPMTGELHRRHHMSPKGYYRGEQVVDLESKYESDTDEEE